MDADTSINLLKNRESSDSWRNPISGWGAEMVARIAGVTLIIWMHL